MDNPQVNDNDKNNIKATLFNKNKVFLPCHKHLNFSTKLPEPQNTEIVTTDNVLPKLKEEAERDFGTKEVIQESYEAVKTQRSTKKRWLSAVFLLINLAVLAGILVYQFLNEPPVSIVELFTSKLNWGWLVIAVVTFLVINFLDAGRVFLVIKKLTGRRRPFLSYKSVACCRFYDSITPLATGGQPFQIYYLSKRGLNASSATSVPIIKYVFAQMTFIIICLLGLLIGNGVIVQHTSSPVVLTMCYIGLALNLLLVLVVLWLSISKKVAPRIMFGILKALKAMHIIKDSRSTFKKVMRSVKDYISIFRMFMCSGWLALAEFLLSILFNLLNYSIAFIVYCIFCPFDITLWPTFALLQLACDLAISFIPLPGGAGTAELSFSAIFAGFYATAGCGNIFVWAIIFYRIMTYYGYLLQGALLLLYDFIHGNKKIEPLLQRFKDEELAKKNNILLNDTNTNDSCESKMNCEVNDNSTQSITKLDTKQKQKKGKGGKK